MYSRGCSITQEEDLRTAARAIGWYTTDAGSSGECNRVGEYERGDYASYEERSWRTQGHS